MIKKNAKYLIASLLLVFGIFSCKKSDSIDTKPTTDYPKAFVVNGGSNTVSIIDLDKLEVKNIIQLTELGRYPHHLSFSPDSLKLAIATPEFDFILGHVALHNATDKKGGIAIVDVKTGNTLQKIALPNANFNAVFSPDGKEIWSAISTHSGEMYVIDASTGTVKNKIALGADPSEVVFSKNGKYVFVALGESSFVYVINAETKTIIKTIKVDLYPTNVWAGSDGNIYVENKNAFSVNIIDAETLIVTGFVDLDFPPSQIAYNQLSKELWICQSNQNAVAYFTKTNNVWSLKGNIQTGLDAHGIAFSKDLKRAFVVNQKGNTVSAIDAVSHVKIKDITVGNQPNGIVIKSDFLKLAQS